jgi:hypothetical protein
MKIEITTMVDSYDCETCGGSWAEGGVVYVDDKKVLERKPSASCFGSSSFSEADLLVMALAKLGHEILVDNYKYSLNSHDDEYYGHKLEEY